MEEQIQKSQKQSKRVSILHTPSPVYSIQKMFKQTASMDKIHVHHYHFSEDKQIHPRTKGLPSIMTKMKQNKAELERTLYRNHSKLNSSFTGYFKSEINIVRDQLKKKKVTKRKNVEEKGMKMIETPPAERGDGGYHDINVRMSPLPNRCFDSLFPAIRYNATLFSNDRQVYLLGGYHQNGLEGLSLFHRYDYEGRRWVQIKGQGESPKLSPCFHTVEIYKNNMIIVGGITFEGEKGKRFNTELFIYNIQKSQWLRARGGVSLKHHSSIIFGSTLMISGGINEKEKYSEDLYFITFTGGNMFSPLIFTVHNHADFNERIAYHKIVHTYELEPMVRNHVKMDGVFSFGGEDENGTLNNDLTFINVLGKVGQNLDIKFKRWELVVTNDEKPCPRKGHSFNVINKKGIGILAGGIEQLGNWLTDVWLFDFVRHHWVRINTHPSIEESIGSLAGHCACTISSTVYLYNGNVQKKREKAFWMLETESSSYKTKKQIFSTKLPSFKSIQTDKQNFSLSKI